jgi:glycosyltransferase involved in cell wall biosynthesis
VKKKIAVIGLKGLPAFGGAASVGENLMDHLKDRYDFTVYALSSHTNIKGEYKGLRQFVIHKFPVKKLSVFYYYIIAALHTVFIGRYDLVHLHQIDGAFILFILRLRYKVISTSHGRTQTVDKWGPLIKRFFAMNEKIFLRYSNEITAVSSELANTYEYESGREIHYIPNGVNLDVQLKDVNEIKENGYILFSAGRIIAKKGCHILLDALNKIKFKGKIIVIGDLNQVPGYKEKLFDLAATLDVKFVDLIKDKPLLMTYIKKARLFVFPSSQEAMSMMLLEVATMKTPLICSDIPENKAVFDENSVLFFETDNADDLSDKLSYALTHPERMDEYTGQAFQVLKDKYQWKYLAEEYGKLYKKILKT